MSKRQYGSKCKDCEDKLTRECFICKQRVCFLHWKTANGQLYCLEHDPLRNN